MIICHYKWCLRRAFYQFLWPAFYQFLRRAFYQFWLEKTTFSYLILVIIVTLSLTSHFSQVLAALQFYLHKKKFPSSSFTKFVHVSANFRNFWAFRFFDIAIFHNNFVVNLVLVILIDTHFLYFKPCKQRLEIFCD